MAALLSGPFRQLFVVLVVLDLAQRLQHIECTGSFTASQEYGAWKIASGK